jgi:hypothetical protein
VLFFYDSPPNKSKKRQKLPPLAGAGHRRTAWGGAGMRPETGVFFGAD